MKATDDELLQAYYNEHFSELPFEKAPDHIIERVTNCPGFKLFQLSIRAQEARNEIEDRALFTGGGILVVAVFILAAIFELIQL